jgi:signal transduction histidine kinase
MKFHVRLTLLIMATASVALLLSSAILVAAHVLSLRNTIEEQLKTDADSIATSSTAALSFGDREAAAENLGILHNQPHVAAACLYDQEGTRFAAYARPRGPAETSLGDPEKPGELGVVFGEDRVEIFHDVRLGGESIGTVYIRRDLLDIRDTLRDDTLIITGVFAVSLFLAMVSTYHFTRRLVRPINELAGTAAAVSQRQDFSMRATKFNDDELGGLTDAFNQMVADIGERDQERQKLVAELEAKNAELERFTYTVSHDLKSPLVTIRGFLGLLAEDAFSGDRERLEEDIAVINKATETMRQLLEDLLELSRIGRIANPSSRLLLQDLAQETVAVLQGPLRKSKVSINVEAADDVPSVLVDQARLREVLQNLIENAVKFMDGQSEPRIDIKVWEDDGKVVCSVQDNGRGVDPRYHEKIFGLFERIDQDVEGTGIGLTLVRRIIDFHGGELWVESQGLGRGSTFTFNLPAHPGT